MCANIAKTKYTQQYIQNMSFDDQLKVQMVEIIGADGNLVTATGGKLDVNATVTATIDPAGLATSTIQTDGTQKTQIVDAGGEQVTVTGGKLDVNASVDTTGLALEAGNLASIKTNTDKIPALGQALAAASVPVILPTDTITTLTPPAAITGFATSAKQLADNHQVTVSNIANTPVITGFATETTLGTVHGHVDSIDTKTPALGQALAAASVPVVLTAAQLTTLTPPAQGLTDAQLRATAVPVSVATIPSHAVTNAGTFAVQSTNQANSGVDIGDVTINNSTGASAVNIQDGGNTITVDGTVTANATLAAETTKVIGTVNVAASQTIAVTNAGTFATQETPATTIYNGKKTVTTAGTRVTLASSQAVKSVTIKALSTNTGLIYVGDTSVASTNGFQLSAGETISLDIANLTTVNIDSSVNGEGVTYIGIN